MQRLADELASKGLVEFIDNPRHRRSKLVRLSRKGRAHYRALDARFLRIASDLHDFVPFVTRTSRVGRVGRVSGDKEKGLAGKFRRTLSVSVSATPRA